MSNFGFNLFSKFFNGDKMEIKQVIELLFHGNQLKRTIRTGWVQRGVPNGENVAAHSFGVVFIAMILCKFL